MPVASAAIGTIVDRYDFFLYGTASALVFPKLFFHSANHTVGTLLSFAVYATGFASRPLGGALCGHFGDRIGRKRVLMFTLLFMGLATTAIGLLPTYSSIGVAAPILLVVIRIMQGFGAGGEWGGASLLTLEHTSRRRGFWGSFRPRIGCRRPEVSAQLAGGTGMGETLLQQGPRSHRRPGACQALATSSRTAGTTSPANRRRMSADSTR